MISITAYMGEDSPSLDAASAQRRNPMMLWGRALLIWGFVGVGLGIMGFAIHAVVALAVIGLAQPAILFGVI